MTQETKPSLVWGEGPKPCDLMLIGEAPGATEEKLGRPFVGKAGEVLEEALVNAGASREVVYITNSYKLRPPKNRDPNERELEEHLGHLRKEFREVQPKRILVLGRVARDHVAPAIRRRNQWWRSPGGIQILYAYHPAAILYNRNLKDDFFDQVTKFIEGNDLSGS